jgi:hypothetical protein
MKTVKIKMVVSTGCQECVKVKARITNILQEAGFEPEFELLNTEDSKTVEFAVDHDLDNVPSFVINKTSFDGQFFSKNGLLDAIK